MLRADIHRRPRGRRMFDALRVAREGLPVPPSPGPPALDLLDRTLGRELPLPGPLAHEMAGRLSGADREAVRAFLRDGGVPDFGPEIAEKPAEVVPLALHVGLPGVERRTGLSAAEPPHGVHAMARGPLAAGGSVFDADFFDVAFAQAGAPLTAGQRVLDFGCSTARILRVWRTALPEVSLVGCDPNGPAIEWCLAHVPGVEFHVSPNAPPMAFVGDGELDAVIALSIWSHFAEAPAVAWLDEMHRVVRPGGHLALTTHGTASVRFYASQPQHDVEDERPVAHELYRSGHFFFPIFGEQGDWGVQDPGWGQAFFSADWLATHACPRWSVRLFVPAAVGGNQDLYVLRREP